MHLWCCCHSAALCVAVLLLRQLPLLIMMCRMTKWLLWFTESGCSVLFLLIRIRLMFNVHICSTVAFTASICPSYEAFGDTGMREAEAGVSPPWRRSPCTYVDVPYMDSSKYSMYKIVLTCSVPNAFGGKMSMMSQNRKSDTHTVTCPVPSVVGRNMSKSLTKE